MSDTTPPPGYDFTRPPDDPKTCLHRFVHQGERWYGKGRYTFWQCNQCDAYLRPQWVVTDSLGYPLKPDGG